MSGYNWNLRHGNASGSNRAPPTPSGKTEIACRLCDRVFMSTQALINHIESHIVDDGITASRLRQLAHQTNINPMISLNPPIPPTATFPILPNPFHGVNNQIGFAPPPPPSPHYQYPYPQQPQVSPYSLPRNVDVNPGVGSHYMLMSSANQMMRMVMEEDDRTTSDITRPFLGQLERPIPRMNHELDNHGNIDNADSNNLDLTLKL